MFYITVILQRIDKTSYTYGHGATTPLSLYTPSTYIFIKLSLSQADRDRHTGQTEIDRQ